MTPKVRAHRILKAMEHYIDFESEVVPDYVIPEAGHIGVYENQLGSAENAILVTFEGIELLGGKRRKIAFADIDRIALPSVDKLEVDNLKVFTVHSDQPIILPVVGQNGRTRDAFEFLRFLKRCLADQKAV